jgi:hypothetical protein
MSVRCIDLGAALAERDPETLLGPLLGLLTRLARGEQDLRECDELQRVLVAHCTALAAHPGAPPVVRIAVGGIGIEQRGRVIARR